MKLIFVTGNDGKFATAQKVMANYNIELIQEKVEIKEIRSDEIEEIAVDKAKQAFQILKKPLIVDDSGFIVESLKKFPGTYVNFVLKSIGLQGLLKLVGEDRGCYFKSVLVYVDETGKTKVFQANSYGTLAETISENEHGEAWSDLWKVFIPRGRTKTMNDMTPGEFAEHKASYETESAFRKFAEWLISDQSYS
jgi:non-canonical purine NTP pyrophosphatase (RdgB/HAM1 family)